MKGVLMKAGQLVSFIFEALPEDAQAALATLQADAAPMAPSLAAGVVTVRARQSTGAGLPRLDRSAGRRGEHRAGPPSDHRRWARRRREGAVPGRRRGHRVRPRRRRDDVRDVLDDDAEGSRRQGVRRRAPGAHARGARLRARGAQRHRVRRAVRRPPVGARPTPRPGAVDEALAHHRVGRRHVVRAVPRDRVVRHQAARRRGPVAVRPARGAAVRDVQRRPSPRQLQVPPRRQHHVPRLRPREALDARRVGVAQPDARRDRGAPRSRCAGRGDGDGRLPAPRPRTPGRRPSSST